MLQEIYSFSCSGVIEGTPNAQRNLELSLPLFFLSVFYYSMVEITTGGSENL